MKAASMLVQAIALSACFAVYAWGGGAISSGVRRAMQTMAASQIAIVVDMPAAESAFLAA